MQNLKENTCITVFFLCNFIKKETLAQVFSCEFNEISYNNFFTEHLWVTASEERRLFKLASNRSVKVCIVFFFHYFKYYVQKISFKNDSALFNRQGWKKRKNFLFKIWNYPFSEKKEKQMFQVKSIRRQKNDCSIIHVSF